MRHQSDSIQSGMNTLLYVYTLSIAATDGNTYTYTRGLYSSDTQLLCTSDSNTALSDIKWSFMDNPLVLDSLQNQETLFSCRISSTATTILQVNLVIQG